MLHRALFGTRRRTAAHIGHNQREHLGAAIAPPYDIRFRQSSGRTLRRSSRGATEGSKFARGALGLPGVFICVVQRGGIGAKSKRADTYGYARGGHPAAHALHADSLDQIGHSHYRHRQTEIIGHLRVVGVELQHGEETKHGGASQTASAVQEHEARYCRRNIAQREKLPYVSRTDDNDEI